MLSRPCRKRRPSSRDDGGVAWVFWPEARRGSQGASRAAPGKSGLHARGEGERVLASPWDSPGRNTRVGCYGLLQGIEPESPESPALQADSLTPEPQGEAPQRTPWRRTRGSLRSSSCLGPEIKPRPPALGAWSLSPWTTREVPAGEFFNTGSTWEA